jgi:hypothetical protein
MCEKKMKDNKKIILGFFCLLILLFASAGITQAVLVEDKEIKSINSTQNPEYATLNGKVVDRRGNGVDLAIVYAKHESTGNYEGWTHYIRTDIDGYYTLEVRADHPDVTKISYTVNATKTVLEPGGYLKPPYESQDIIISDLSPGETRELPNLVLPIGRKNIDLKFALFFSMIAQRISILSTILKQ